MKVELRETAFNLWMGCYSAQEIADTIGYSKPAVIEFTNFLQSVTNGTSANSDLSSENPVLTSDGENREFDDDDQDDGSSLGVYKLDKRLLIKANHLDEHFTPPLSGQVFQLAPQFRRAPRAARQQFDKRQVQPRRPPVAGQNPLIAARLKPPQRAFQAQRRLPAA